MEVLTVTHTFQLLVLSLVEPLEGNCTRWEILLWAAQLKFNSETTPTTYCTQFPMLVVVLFCL